MSTDDWTIVLPANRVQIAAKDRRFGALLAAARAANAITIARGPLLVDVLNDSPQASRERFSALFYVAATLVEAMFAADALVPYFSGSPNFEDGLGKLLIDPEVTEFRSKTLKKFRDKGTFHFDEGFFRKAASQLADEDVVLAILKSGRIDDIYVNVTDDLLFRHILGPFSSDEMMVAAFADFSSKTVELMMRFLISMHEFLPQALRDLGAERRRPV